MYYSGGELYNNSGNNEKALEYFLKAYQFIKENDYEVENISKMEIGDLIYKISKIYFENADYEESEKVISVYKAYMKWSQVILDDDTQIERDTIIDKILKKNVDKI